MIKLTNLAKTIQPDKALHFIAGQAAFIVAFLLSGNAEYGLAASCIAGVGKEAYDKIVKKGKIDVFDALATIAGGLIPYLLMAVPSGT